MGLFSQKCARLRDDLVRLYKTMGGHRYSQQSIFPQGRNNCKIHVSGERNLKEIKRVCFSGGWGWSLQISEEVVQADTIRMFKRLLDRYFDRSISLDAFPNAGKWD